MGVSQYFSSLNCELRIMKAKNIESKPSSNYFVRYYLSTTNSDKRIKLNTREISSKSQEQQQHELEWNEFFSLECLGKDEESTMQSLMQQTLVFELRCRNTRSQITLVGKLLGGSSSILVGRVEVPWKTVLESPEMEIEEWFTLLESKKSHALEDGKPPRLQVGMKVRVQTAEMMKMEEKRRRRNGRLKKWDECGCKDGACRCNCVDDDDIFALAALMEAL